MLRPVFSRTGVPSSSTNPLGVFAVVCVWAGATGAAAGCVEVLAAGACCSARCFVLQEALAHLSVKIERNAQGKKIEARRRVLIMTTLLKVFIDDHII